MRERGSNTARPTEKGGGGLPIGARPVDFGASFRADSVDFGASFRADSVDFVASRRDLQTSSCRFGRDSVDSVGFGASIRADSVDSVAISSRFADFLLSIRADTQADTQETPKLTRRKHKKSPIPQSGNRASAIARCRALLTFC